MFKEKVLKIVKKIPPGDFLTYKEVAKLAGNEKAYRVVANILAKNKDSNIPCHRVIRNDNLVGGYKGKEDLDWMKAAMLLKEGAIGVIPTDTIYGICTSAFNKKSVEKVYKLRKRNPNKPCIILISSLEDLKKFNIRLTLWQKKILEKLWPGKVSVVLGMQTMQTSRRLGGTNEDFIDLAWTNQNKISARSAFHSAMSAYKYLHRGTNSLAFRLPKNKLILNILKISGPLIAPSANWEGYEPAKNIKEAKKYFGNKVFYLDRGDLISKPSSLIDLRTKKIQILREGEGIKKIKRVLKHYNI
ncbi:MAG: methylated-DNA--[protein]-cysteine S-methyltransferase [Minisyncoccia bacterium]|jgi:L-threonylcarbamoyladenylate synthase